jgi:hypothetical protein
MISVIISIILAVLLAVAILVITHQKKAHNDVVLGHEAALAAEKEWSQTLSSSKEYFAKKYYRVQSELNGPKLKIEADAANLAAEPAKVVAAVKSKVKGKKA